MDLRHPYRKNNAAQKSSVISIRSQSEMRINTPVTATDVAATGILCGQGCIGGAGLPLRVCRTTLITRTLRHTLVPHKFCKVVRQVHSKRPAGRNVFKNTAATAFRGRPVGAGVGRGRRPKNWLGGADKNRRVLESGRKRGEQRWVRAGQQVIAGGGVCQRPATPARRWRTKTPPGIVCPGAAGAGPRRGGARGCAPAAGRRWRSCSSAAAVPRRWRRYHRHPVQGSAAQIKTTHYVVLSCEEVGPDDLQTV